MRRARSRPTILITYELYRELLETAVQGLDFGNDALPLRGVVPRNLLMPINQMDGVQTGVPRTIAMMPAGTRENYEDIVSRLEGVGRLVDQTIALMERGLAAGLTPPRVALRDLPGQVAAQIAADPLASPLLAAFRTWPASIPEAERGTLASRARAAYTDGVVPALERLHAFLTSSYLPRCRETVGISRLPTATRCTRTTSAGTRRRPGRPGRFTTSASQR